MNKEPDKIQLEREVLLGADSLLRKLYGEYSVDDEQTDKPDAAILVKKPHKRLSGGREPIKVGIEITIVDSREYLAYFGDNKFGRDLVDTQFENTLRHGVDPEKLNKQFKVKIPETYIFDGIKSKAKNYEAYAEKENFGEVILLCFSNVLESGSAFLKEGLIEWTNYYLSQVKFPYAKVLFLPFRSTTAIKIYDKRTPLNQQPSPYDFEDPWIITSDWPMLLTGKTYNILDFYNSPPLVNPKKKK